MGTFNKSDRNRLIRSVGRLVTCLNLVVYYRDRFASMIINYKIRYVTNRPTDLIKRFRTDLLKVPLGCLKAHLPPRILPHPLTHNYITLLTQLDQYRYVCTLSHILRHTYLLTYIQRHINACIMAGHIRYILAYTLIKLCSIGLNIHPCIKIYRCLNISIHILF